MTLDRKKLIDKLKSVKDPRQRDKIIWALSGLEKDMPSDTKVFGELRKRVIKPSREQKQIPRPAQEQRTVLKPSPEQRQEIPGLPAGVGARQLFAYVVPGLFLFFGLMQFLPALMDIISTGGVEKKSFPQLIMGAMFLVFGITGIIKANRKAKEPEPDQESKKQA